MTRSELVRCVARDNPALPREDVERSIALIFDAMRKQLIAGGRVELRHFGAFSTRSRVSRLSHNPRTGQSVDVAAKRVPYFKPGKELREMIVRSGAIGPNE